MGYALTVIRRDPWDVEPRLQELSLTSAGLRRIRDVARAARTNVTGFHAVNAPGTYAYHEGIWCLRDEFVGEIWKLDRPDGVEAIINTDKTARVSFANVDRCCDDGHDPLPFSKKGSGVERLCQPNLFGSLPTYVRRERIIGIPLFYCMVDLEGRIEFSRPTVTGDTFGSYVERNYISNGGDEDYGSRKPIEPVDDSAVQLTPMISRKAA